MQGLNECSVPDEWPARTHTGSPSQLACRQGAHDNYDNTSRMQSYRSGHGRSNVCGKTGYIPVCIAPHRPCPVGTRPDAAFTTAATSAITEKRGHKSRTECAEPAIRWAAGSQSSFGSCVLPTRYLEPHVGQGSVPPRPAAYLLQEAQRTERHPRHSKRMCQLHRRAVAPTHTTPPTYLGICLPIYLPLQQHTINDWTGKWSLKKCAQVLWHAALSEQP